MRILITGGCGFLGAHLVEHFLKTTDAEIVILDKMTYASSGFDRLRDIEAYDDKRVRVLGCDLSQPIPDGVQREVGQIDYVIHAAAETHVDNSITDPLPFYQSNVLGTHHLLWWFKRMTEGTYHGVSRASNGPKRIFLVSTDEVYGPADWDHPGHKESDPFRPANPYAASKAGGESIGMSYENTYKLPITIVNTMNLIGERQHTEKYVPLVIRSVLLGHNVRIHADSTRTRSGTRFYIHCRNFASALAFLIQRDNNMRYSTDLPGTVMPMPIKIHVAGEREISNLDLAQMIAGFVGKELCYELVNWHESRPGHDLRYALDASAIRSMGWKQPIDIEVSLEKTVRWYLDNRKWLGL